MNHYTDMNYCGSFYLFFWWLGIGNDIGNFEAEKVC